MAGRKAAAVPPVPPSDDRDRAPNWLIGGSAATLGAALLAPFGALPLFHFGYYELVAASILWLHLCAGVAAALIASGTIAAPRLACRSLVNPATLCLFGFAALTTIPVLYADHPMLVVFGSPQSGKGLLWFIDCALFVAAGWLIRNHTRAVSVVIWTAILTTAAVAGMRIFVAATGTELLLPGGDSYAYLGLLLPFLVLLHAKPQRSPWLQTVAFAVAATCVGASANKAAIATFLVLTVAYLCLRFMPAATISVARFRFVWLYPAVLAAAVALSYVVVSIDFRGVFDSIDSRVLIARIVMAALSDSSNLEWISGHGWGHTQAAFYRYLTESGASLLDNRWDFLWRDIFHSHNLVFELVYETGALGLAVFAAMLAALVASADSGRRIAALIFVLGYLMMNSVWFEFAHSLPMLALAVLSLSRDTPVRRSTERNRTAPWLVFAATTSLACVVAAATLYNFDRRVPDFKMDRGVLPRTDYPTGEFPEDPRGNDFIRAAVYREIVRTISHLAQSSVDAVDPKVALGSILDDIESRLARTTNPELLLVGMVIFNDAYYDSNRVWVQHVVDGRDALWDRLAARHLALSPKRTDVLVVFLSWLIANNEEARAAEIVAQLLNASPEEPVGLYFRGVINTRASDPSAKRRGLAEIAQAVDNGVERYLEVPDWLKQMAEKARTR